MSTTYNNSSDYSPTQYNVVTGGATNQINNVAPSATSGVPLISQGSSSQPIFGTAVVAGGGTGATTLTGVLIGNGTSAVTGNAVTQYDVLVGGASNAISSVAPSATSGVPLVSGGSSSNPSFTTAVVAGGGTGVVTMTTAYAPVCAGTTATGALQVASTGLSTSGYVLTSNGSSALPSFQAAGGGSITLTGDSGGGLTGSSFTITTGNSTQNSGATVAFAGSGTTLTLNVTDLHNTTLIGNSCGNATYTGQSATGVGGLALFALSTGNNNTGVGNSALGAVTTGHENTGFGAQAMYGVITGSNNVGVGYETGKNYSGAESSNIIIGAGVNGTNGESNVLRIGNGTGTTGGAVNKAIICGITGIAVTGVAALISAANQLGVAASSQRFKNDIKDMSEESSPVLSLRPVTFVWNKKSSPGLLDAPDDRQFGIIAEEAAKVMPSLVVYGEDGNPFSFKYTELPAILLNELQKAIKRIEILEKKLEGK